jgi:hypothetical protein
MLEPVGPAEVYRVSRASDRESEMVRERGDVAYPRTVAQLALARAATALAVMSVGALALGVVAIGRIAMRRLLVGEGRIKRLSIEELEIGRLRIIREPKSTPSVREAAAK